MKKLMIAMVAIAITVVARAATVQWTMANVYDSTGASKYSGEATLFAYLSTSTAADAVEVMTLTVSSGAITASAGTFSTDAVTAGNEYFYYFVIEDGDKRFTSATTANAIATQSTSNTKVQFGNMTSQTQNASNWVNSSVPEPTSGLLILLGMAGLALKRKRA